jgi:putative endonuclease
MIIALHMSFLRKQESSEESIQREKRLKIWKRKWKLELIEKVNPGWEDLYDKLLG